MLVHQLARFATQNPFRKNRGRVMRVSFHPTKPFFFVATQNAVRIYNLAKQVRGRRGVCPVAALKVLHLDCMTRNNNFSPDQPDA